MSKASEDDIHALFEALPLDWKTTSPAPAPPIPANGEPHPCFGHANLQQTPVSKTCELEYCQVNG